MGSAISDMHLSLRCLPCSRPAYKQPLPVPGTACDSTTNTGVEGCFGGGGESKQQHQITNNFPICIFWRMVRHLSLMHLPVHPEGLANLKKGGKRFKAFTMYEIGPLCEYKIEGSDNQNALNTDRLWIIFSRGYLHAIEYSSRMMPKTSTVYF